uniref:Ysc84 actin-binding domain-containing protein n=1 Tax=Cyanothece sp. (strain PCC 7425 / ATCC 29141) TaxID=395961 RepID=B8HU09_CYAP4
MKNHPLLFVPVAAAVILTVSHPALANPVEEVQVSNNVFQDLVRGTADQRIPPEILRNAQGIAILTNVTRGGFFLFGGRRGDGTLLVRNQTGGWSNPVFINITGGNFGPQFGVSSTDIILVFMNRESIDRLLREPLDLGGSISVAAGPVGGNVVSPVADPSPNIYAYSRSEGLFAGVTLSGSKVSYDARDTARFYGRSVTPQEVFTGQVPTPPGAVALRSTLDQYGAAALR